MGIILNLLALRVHSGPGHFTRLFLGGRRGHCPLEREKWRSSSATRLAHGLSGDQYALLYIRPHWYFNTKRTFVGGLEGFHLSQVAVKDSMFICACQPGVFGRAVKVLEEHPPSYVPTTIYGLLASRKVCMQVMNGEIRSAQVLVAAKRHGCCLQKQQGLAIRFERWRSPFIFRSQSWSTICLRCFGFTRFGTERQKTTGSAHSDNPIGSEC